MGNKNYYLNDVLSLVERNIKRFQYINKLRQYTENKLNQDSCEKKTDNYTFTNVVNDNQLEDKIMKNYQ